MRVAQVAGYLSADGLFGGPLAVSVEQCTELARRGHDVLLYVGWDGIAALPAGGFEVRAFPVGQVVPKAGLSGLLSPRLLRDLHASLGGLDAVHLHAGRDLLGVSATAVALRRRPVHLQTHGMVMPDPRPRSRVMDALATRRQLAGAASVLYLTDEERDGLLAVGRGRARLARLRNGVLVPPASEAARHRAAEPVVLFCARLHPRKRVTTFLEIARQLAARHPELRFRVAGADEGDGPAVQRFVAEHPAVPVHYLGALDRAGSLEQMRAADVLVLPSVNEPFPMSVLEAMAQGTPVVLTDSCGIAAELAGLDAAAVTSPDAAELAAAVEALCTDEQLWARRSRTGRETIATRFSIGAVVDELETCYRAGVAAA